MPVYPVERHGTRTIPIGSERFQTMGLLTCAENSKMGKAAVQTVKLLKDSSAGSSYSAYLLFFTVI